MKLQWYFCDVFRCNFYFCIGWTQKSYEHFLKTKFNAEFNLETECHGHTYFDSKIGTAIWIRNKTDVISLAHECLHAANYTLNRIGNQASHTNDEVLAYLQGSLIRFALGKRKK
jgi:hypothetical protein